MKNELFIHEKEALELKNVKNFWKSKLKSIR